MREDYHCVGDGRGARDVYVNGVLVHGAISADIRRGVVEFIPQPARLRRNRKEVYTRKLRGVVTGKSK